MITLLFGKNTYDSYLKAKELLDSLALQNNFTKKIVDADLILDPNIFLQEIEGVGMFDNGSVILAKRLLENKKLIAFLLENFESLNNYPIIIWQDGAVDSRLKIVQKLKSRSGFLEFNEPKEVEVRMWLDSKLQKANIKLSRDLLDFIISHIGLNKWHLENEISKLVLYFEYAKTEITEKTLSILMGYEINGDIWRFIDCFGNRNKAKAIEEFLKLNRYEDNTQYIIAMIARELRIFLSIIFAKKNNIEPRSIGLNPYVLNKSLGKVHHFKENELKFFSKKLLELDIAVKTGRVDEQTALILFLNLL